MPGVGILVGSGNDVVVAVCLLAQISSLATIFLEWSRRIVVKES